jgi:uncharacterized protein YaiI (UPF0178 family)
VKIWVDADACPREVKELLYRAADRLSIATVFVANGNLTLPRSPHLSTVRVGAGLDVADRYVAQHAEAGDLAITADIPLAAALVEKRVCVLDPRGELYDADNISERLAVRDLMAELREGGLATGGPKSYDSRDKQRFANALDRELARLRKP